MLSDFWFLFFLLVIWSLTFFSIKDDDDDLFKIAIIIALVLSIVAYGWLFEAWFKQIYNIIPQDNKILMLLTAGLIFIVELLSLYFFPPMFMWFVVQKVRTKRLSDRRSINCSERAALLAKTQTDYPQKEKCDQ